jgi:hypothetical protein
MNECMYAHLEVENPGMNAQLLVIAPKPDRRPRMIVPTTMRRARAVVMVCVPMPVLSLEWYRACGRGIWEKR